jgi:hypothetical protein
MNNITTLYISKYKIIYRSWNKECLLELYSIDYNYKNVSDLKGNQDNPLVLFNDLHADNFITNFISN